MGRTKVRGVQIVSDTIDSDLIKQGSVSRADLNTTTVGSAVIAKVIQGTGITITSTGADSGTGDVTINAVNNGTVTSVGLALPAIFTVSNSPVTSSGTLTAVLASQTANTFLAAPNGSAGVPSFRAIVAADIPTLNQTTTGGAGTLVREDNRVISPSELTAGRLRFSFTSWNNDNNTPYADGLHLRSYTDASGGNDNLVMFRKDAIGMRVYQQTWGSATAYATYKDVAFTDSNITGSAATLTTARNINGTAFNGSADITTANWGTARTITIGSTGKSVNGSADVAWSLADIGAQAAGSYATTSDISITANRLAYGNATGTGITSSAKFVVSGSQLQLLDNGGGQTNLRLGGGTADNNWGGGLEMTSSNGTTVLAKMLASVNGIFFSQNGTDHFAVARSTGNFMIGTTTDSGYKLDVYGTAMFRNTAGTTNNFSVDNNGNATIRQTLTVGGATNSDSVLINSLAGTGSLMLQTTNTIAYVRSQQDLSLGSGASNDRVIIKSGGNVLIGTTTDNGAKFQVTGSSTFSSKVYIGGIADQGAYNLQSTGNAHIAGFVVLPQYASGGAGTYKMLVTDSNGELSAQTIPSATGTVTSITAGTGLTGGTITTSGTIAIDQAAQIVSTKANDTATGGGQLYLNGATGNRIDFNANGAGAPTVTTRSVGTKLVLNPSVSASAVDTAIGFSSDSGVPSLWFSIPSSSTSGAFRWYTGATERIRVDQAGQIRFTAGTVSAPVISAGLSSSDTNTGIYFPAADTIGFVEGGVEAMRIDSNGRINVLAGTAALPAISAGLNSSDTNTGIYFPAADSISIATAGVERMNINSSGVPTFTYADNTFQGVNIRNTSNTSNALNGLTIYDAANSAMGQINYVNAIYANSFLQDTFVINSVGDRKLGFIANSNGSAGGNSDIYFQAGSSAAGRIIYISGIDGVISVGMGVSEASNTRMQIRGIGATSSTATLRVENSAGTEALTVMDDGQIRVRAGTVSLPSISAGLNSSDTNTGIYFPATDAIALATNGTRRLHADATGVGIHVDPTEWIHLSSEPSTGKYIQIDAAQYNAAPLEYTPSGGLNKIYGSTFDNNALGTPDYWMEIKLDGTIVLIPCYAPYYP